MALVHIDNLVAGMVVTRKVCDRSGRMLLPAGMELTERHLGILRMWGVLEVEIADGAETTEAADERDNIEVDPELLADAQEKVQRLFVHNDPEHPAIRELMRICVNRSASIAE